MRQLHPRGDLFADVSAKGFSGSVSGQGFQNRARLGCIHPATDRAKARLCRVADLTGPRGMVPVSVPSRPPQVHRGGNPLFSRVSPGSAWFATLGARCSPLLRGPVGLGPDLRNFRLRDTEGFQEILVCLR